MECQGGLAMRKVSVCSSVCPSVKHVDCDKTEERSVQIPTPCKRSFSNKTIITVKQNLNDKLQVSNGEIHFTRECVTLVTYFTAYVL